MVVGCIGGAHGQRGLQGHGSLQVTGIKIQVFRIYIFILALVSLSKFNHSEQGGYFRTSCQAHRWEVRVLAHADGNFQVLAMLGESLVPKPARHFFNVVSSGVSTPENLCFIF